MIRTALLIFLLLLSACTGSEGAGRVSEPVDASAGLGPFAPVQMHIYPLSHIQSRSDPRLPPGSKPRIVCHLEFTDRWYDTVKAVGLVDVQLYRSGGAGYDVQHARWRVDLADLTANADWFDPVTRTYRLQLNLPDWAQESLGDTCRVTVVFTPAGDEGGRSVMRDEITLRTRGPGTPMPDATRFPEDAREFRPPSPDPDGPAPIDPAPESPAETPR